MSTSEGLTDEEVSLSDDGGEWGGEKRKVKVKVSDQTSDTVFNEGFVYTYRQVVHLLTAGCILVELGVDVCSFYLDQHFAKSSGRCLNIHDFETAKVCNCSTWYVLGSHRPHGRGGTAKNACRRKSTRYHSNHHHVDINISNLYQSSSSDDPRRVEDTIVYILSIATRG